jgi:predicted metalloprotease
MRSWRAGVVVALAMTSIGLGSAAVPAGAARRDAPTPSTTAGTSSSRSADDVIRAAIDDVQGFWITELPNVYGKQYAPIPAGRLDAYTSTSWPPACGDTGTTPYEDVENNAFYCSVGDFFAWDSEKLIPTLRAQFGDFAVALVAAHEIGHAVQERTGTSSGSTIPVELQADCFAGAWAQHATRTADDEFNVAKGDLEEALSGYLYFRDPTGTDPRTEGAHGSAFDRISAFSDGFAEGGRALQGLRRRPADGHRDRVHLRKRHREPGQSAVR